MVLSVQLFIYGYAKVAIYTFYRVSINLQFCISTCFWGVWKIIAFVLSVLRDSLLTFNYSLILESSSLMFTFDLNLKVLRVLESQVSSAYIFTG